jgi:hypothetical protein
MPLIGGKNAKKTSSSDSKRHFTVVMGNKEHGLYISSNPSSAARKAVTKLCATDKKKKVQFSIREITQGSKKKTYGPYLGEIEKLAKPIELKGRVIKYKPVAKLNKKTDKKSVVKKGGMRKMRGGEGIQIESKFDKFHPIKITKEITVNGVISIYINLINKQNSNSPPIELSDEGALEFNFDTNTPNNGNNGNNGNNFKTAFNNQNPSYKIEIEWSEPINDDEKNNLFSILEKVSSLPKNEYDNLVKQINSLNSTQLDSSLPENEYDN